MRQISDALDNPDADRKDIKTVFMALQKQNFVLGNSLTNVLEQWTTIEEVASKFGHLLETKSSTST